MNDQFYLEALGNWGGGVNKGLSGISTSGNINLFKYKQIFEGLILTTVAHNKAYHCSSEALAYRDNFMCSTLKLMYFKL